MLLDDDSDDMFSFRPSGQRWRAMLFTSPTTEPWRPSHRGNQLQGSVYKNRDKLNINNERRICVDQESVDVVL